MNLSAYSVWEKHHWWNKAEAWGQTWNFYFFWPSQKNNLQPRLPWLFLLLLIYFYFCIKYNLLSNWFPYNTQCSSQQVPSMPITHFPLSPTPHQPSVCSQYLRVPYGLPPLSVTFFPPLPLPTGLLLSFSGPTYEWKNMVSFSAWLISLSLTLQFHPRYKRPDFILSHCQVVFHCVYINHDFFIHSSVDGHLGSFHNLAIVESTAINIGVQVPLCISTPVSLG